VALENGHHKTHTSIVHELGNQVNLYIDSILIRQQPDGWLGPPPNDKGPYWSRSSLILGLVQKVEADPRQRTTIKRTLLRCIVTWNV
jgi:hypothetical protein